MIVLAHSSWSSLAPTLALGLFMFALQFTALSTEQLERMLAASFIDAMQRAQLSVKEMAYALRIDEALLRRQLSPAHPQQHLSLQRLVDYAPLAWWMHFGPSLIYILSKREWTALADVPSPEAQVG